MTDEQLYTNPRFTEQEPEPTGDVPQLYTNPRYGSLDAERIASGVSPVDPDALAKHRENARVLGISTESAQAAPDDLDRMRREQELANGFRQDPVARAVSKDLDTAALVGDDLQALAAVREQMRSLFEEQQRFEEQGFFARNFVNPLRRGIGNFIIGVNTAEVAEGAERLDLLADTELDPQFQPPAEVRDLVTERVEGDIAIDMADIRKKADELAELPRDIEFEQALSTEQVGPVLEAIFDDPSRAWRLVVEGLGTTLPALGAGIFGGVFGASAASFWVEEGAATAEALNRRGVDISGMSADQAIQVLQDDTLRQEVRSEAAAKAGTIAFVDLLSFGLASRIIAPARVAGRALTATERNVVNLMAQTPLQGVFEATGEGLGQLVAFGEVNAADVLVEGIAGAGMSLADIGVFGGKAAFDLYRDGRAAERVLARHEARGSAQVDALIAAAEAAQGTQLVARAPDLLQAYLAEAKAGGAEQVYVSPEAFREFGQELDTTLEQMGVSRQEFEDAEFRGGFVELATEDLLVNPIAAEFLSNERQHVKVNYDGVTEAEAADVREMSREDFAKAVAALEQPVTDDEGQTVYEDVFQQLMDTGRVSETQARNYARLWQSTFQSFASRAGTSAAALYDRFRPAISRGTTQPFDNRAALLIQQVRSRADRQAVLDALPQEIAFLAEKVTTDEALKPLLERRQAELTELQAQAEQEVVSPAQAQLERALAERGIDVREVGATEALRILEESQGRTFEQGAVFEGLEAGRVSTRFPTAKTGTIGDPFDPATVVGLEAALQAPRYLTSLVNVLTAPYAPNTRTLKQRGKEVTRTALEGYPMVLSTPGAEQAEVVEEFIGSVVDNLLWLFDQVPEATRNRSRQWYVGANRFAQHLVRDHPGLTPVQAAGVIAATSPQKDWFQNASIAERIIDIWQLQQDHVWDDAMEATAQRIYGAQRYAESLDAIRGRSLSQAENNLLRGMWVRVYDQTYHESSYRMLSPEGALLDFARNLDGKPAAIQWGNNNEIAKAVAVLVDGRPENVSEMMGTQHKVRSFFNNIIAPFSTAGDVTIDTHAVAAGLLRPLGASATEVIQNFGGRGAGSNDATGLQGMYSLYAEAYRRAAAQRDVLPREMQSITWEAVRGLFTAPFKVSPAALEVDEAWLRFSAGESSLDETRAAVLDIAGGINAPAWETDDAGPDSRGAGQAPTTSYERRVPEADVPGGDTGPDSSGAGSDDAGRVQGPGPEVVDRVTWEAIPSPALDYPILSMPEDVQRVYTQGVQGLLVNEDGSDQLAEQLGVPIAWSEFGVGAYEGALTPNVITNLSPQEGAEPLSREFARAYARGIQYLAEQNAVPWFRSISLTNEGGTMARGVNLQFAETITPDTERALFDALRERLGDDVGFTRIDGNNVVVINFRGDDNVPFLESDDEVFAGAVADAGDTLGADATGFWADGEYGEVADWSQGEAEGERLLAEGPLAGQPAVQEWLRGRREDARQLREQLEQGSELEVTTSRAEVVTSAQAFGQQVAEELGLERFELADSSNGAIVLEWVVVPKELRKQGIGTQAMERLIAFADQQGRRIELDPASRDDDVGTTSRARLVRFYKRFGFVENKGRNRDLETLAEMYREPGREFAQSRRGSFRISNDRSQRIINLFDTADSSTFLHESAHFFLEVVRDLDQLGQYDRADVDTLFAYLGVESWEAIETPQHEAFAEAFEKYLFEGRAPSDDLRTVFRQFADWLRSIYRTARRIGQTGVRLNDEIRHVLDRLVAGHDAIDEQVRRGPYLPSFESAEAAGMTEAEFERYRTIAGEAVEGARERIMKRLMKDITRRRTKERKARLAEFRERAEAEVSAEPVWQAYAYLKERKLLEPSADPDARIEFKRLDADDVSELLGPDAAALLPTITVKRDGQDPQLVAEQFGYRTAQEMLQDILGLAQMIDGKAFYRTVNQEIGQRADRMLDTDEGTSLSPERIRAEAAAAMNNVDRSELLAIELRQLEQLGARARGRRPAERQVTEQGPGTRAELEENIAALRREAEEAVDDVARQDALRRLQIAEEQAEVARAQRERDRQVRSEAQEALKVRQRTFRAMAERYVRSQMTVGDLGRLGRFLADQRKASREANLAITRQDWSRAQLAKQREMWAHFVYSEAVKAREKRDVAQRLFKRWRKAIPGKVNAANEYVEQIQTVLAAHNVGPSRIDPEVARSLMGSVRAFVEAKNELGEQIVVPESVYDAKAFETITIDAMSGLVDAVRSLSKWGNENSEQAKQTFLDEMDALGSNITANVGVRRDREELGRITGGARDFIDHVMLSHRKAEHLMRELDHFEDLGPMWRRVFQPITEAASNESRLREEAMEGFRDIWNELRRLTSKDRTRRNLVAGVRKTREEMIAIGLNWGNQGNREALMNGSREISEEQFDSIVAELRDDEWDFIERVWSFIDRYWPAIAELERRTTGVAPEKVEGLTFQLPSGRVIRGGYYPIKFDPVLSPGAKRDATQEQAKQLMSGDYARAHTRHGFTKERKGSQDSGKRVRLSLDVMFRHVDEVIHDLTHREAVMDVSRVLNSRPIQNSLAARYGVQVNNYLNRWLQNVAAGTVEPHDMSQIIFRHLRVGMSVAEMGLSLRTMLVQPAGFTQTVAKIGPLYAMRGLASFAWQSNGNVFAKVSYVNDKSDYMVERGKVFDRDIAAASRRLNPGNVLDRMRDMSFWGISKLDMMVSYASWLGQYDKAIAEGKNEKDAVLLADQLVRTTQGSGLAKDLADIQAGGEGKRILTAFYTFFASYHNMVTDAIKQTGIKANEQGIMYATGYAANQFLWLVAFPALLSAAALDGGPEDDEELWQWLRDVMLGYGFSGMAFVRDAMMAATTDFGYSGPPVFRTIETALNFQTQVAQGEVDKALVRSGMMATGYFAQLPTRQAWRSVESIWDYLEGDADAIEATASFAGLRHFKD